MDGQAGEGVGAASGGAGDTLEPRHRDAVRRAQRVARLLDSAFRVPGTEMRFGLDTVAGLIPVVGDTVTALVGMYPLAEAVRFGVRKRVIAQMGLNLGIDWVIGLVPLADVVLDAVFKANIRNVRLLTRELEAGRVRGVGGRDGRRRGR